MNARFSKHSPRANSRGFTLVEIGIVVIIIGLLAVLALPALSISQRNARSARFINDVRNAAQMFNVAAVSLGNFPDDSAPGVIPVGMEDDLSRIKWEEKTAVGGNWDWILDDPDYYAGVGVVDPTQARDVFLRIDSRIDDGDLSTGTFRESTSFTGYVFIVE